MTSLRLRCQILLGFSLWFGVCIGVLGCGPDSLSTGSPTPACVEELPAGATCDAFCERVIVDCDLFNGVTRDSCIQGCECELRDAAEISQECGEALENGFLCTSELTTCQSVFDWFNQTPRDNFPCRGANLDVIAACEG